jgi:hypothetical protein
MVIITLIMVRECDEFNAYDNGSKFHNSVAFTESVT